MEENGHSGPLTTDSLLGRSAVQSLEIYGRFRDAIEQSFVLVHCFHKAGYTI
jgi:hypothetical protein